MADKLKFFSRSFISLHKTWFFEKIHSHENFFQFEFLWFSTYHKNILCMPWTEYLMLFAENSVIVSYQSGHTLELLRFRIVTHQSCHASELSHIKVVMRQSCHRSELSYIRDVTNQRCHASELSDLRVITSSLARPSTHQLCHTWLCDCNFLETVFIFSI